MYIYKDTYTHIQNAQEILTKTFFSNLHWPNPNTFTGFPFITFLSKIQYMKKITKTIQDGFMKSEININLVHSLV